MSGAGAMNWSLPPPLPAGYYAAPPPASGTVPLGAPPTHPPTGQAAASAASPARVRPTPQPVVARCEPCRRDFARREQYDAHLVTHEKCSFCDFSSSSKYLQVHVRQQHEKGSAALPIVDTPEQIAAWIAERKKRWPSEGNIKRKLEEERQGHAKEPAHVAKRPAVVVPSAASAAPNPLGIDYAGSDDDGRSSDAESTRNSSDDEAPEPSASTAREQPALAAPEAPPAGGGTSKAAAGRVCRYFMRGKCRNGDRCSFLHERPSPQRTTAPAPSKKAPAHSSLLRELLSGDMRRERGVLLQCIQYICNQMDNRT